MKPSSGGRFRDIVCRKEERMQEGLKARSRGILSWFGTIGMIGWSVAVPLLLGVFLGKWLDSVIKKQYSFTLMLMFTGLVIGCVNAWLWVKKALGSGPGTGNKKEEK